MPVISLFVDESANKRKQENMADMMNVRLSSQAAAAHWGEGALLSFNGDEAHLHLGSGQGEGGAARHPAGCQTPRVERHQARQAGG